MDFPGKSSAGTSYVLTHFWVYADHSNVAHAWKAIRTTDDQGTLRLASDLPMPAMSFLQLTPHQKLAGP